jgi:hypothetical protein
MKSVSGGGRLQSAKDGAASRRVCEHSGCDGRLAMSFWGGKQGQFPFLAGVAFDGGCVRDSVALREDLALIRSGTVLVFSFLVRGLLRCLHKTPCRRLAMTRLGQGRGLGGKAGTVSVFGLAWPPMGRPCGSWGSSGRVYHSSKAEQSPFSLKSLNGAIFSWYNPGLLRRGSTVPAGCSGCSVSVFGPLLSGIIRYV